jgi:hypothetical protein
MVRWLEAKSSRWPLVINLGELIWRLREMEKKQIFTPVCICHKVNAELQSVAQGRGTLLKGRLGKGSGAEGRGSRRPEVGPPHHRSEIGLVLEFGIYQPTIPCVGLCSFQT